MKIILTTLNAKFSHSSLALRYLAQVCIAQGWETDLREYTINQGIDDILADIMEQPADVVAFACYIWNRRETLRLMAMIKQISPETMLIVGGPEAACDAEAVAEHPGVDLVVCGEGEVVLPRILEQVTKGVGARKLATVPGLSFTAEGDQVYNTGWAVLEDLTRLPSVYDERALAELQGKIIYYESSRGCPFQCQYCLSSLTQGVRYVPLPRVLEDLALFDRCGVRQVKFVDRTFNAKPEHYMPILEYIAAAAGKTNYHFEVAADLFDESALTLLASIPPGRVQLEVGVQSTHEATLTAIKRKTSWVKLSDNVRRLRASGNIHLHLDLIAGLPKEDLAAFGRSFNDVYALQPHMLQLGFLKLLPGAGIRLQAAEHAYRYDAEAPYRVLGNRYMSYGDLRLLHFLEQALEQTYNAGRGLRLLQWMATQYGGNAFRLFVELTIFWEGWGFFRQAQGTGKVYELLYEFAVAKWPDQARLIRDLLRWDILVKERGQLRPAFLPWLVQGRETYGDFWRREEVVRRYLPGYRFTSWRDIQRQYIIERFRVAAIPAQGEVEASVEQEGIILFKLDGETTGWFQLQEQDIRSEGESV